MIGSEAVLPSGSLSTTSKPRPVVQNATLLRRLQVYWNFGVVRKLHDMSHERDAGSHALVRRVDTHQCTTARTGIIVQMREILEGAHGNVASHP